MRPTYDDNIVAMAKAVDFGTALKQYIVASQGAEMSKDVLALARNVLMYKLLSEERDTKRVVTRTVTKNGMEVPLEIILDAIEDYQVSAKEKASQYTSTSRIRNGLATLIAEVEQAPDTSGNQVRLRALREAMALVDEATSISTSYELEVRAAEH